MKHILEKVKKLTHEHKMEVFLLFGGSLFNISFGIERILIYKKINMSPLTWGFIWICLGLIMGGVALWDLMYDLDKDNSC